MTRRVDAYSLRLFAAVAQEGSIVRAAAREHIAPSALSRRLTDLEHAFGTPLLVRSPRGVQLTEAGLLVFERGQQIDQGLQQLAREVQSLDGRVAGTVRVAANTSAVVGFLPERLKTLLARHPALHVSLKELDTPEVVRSCLDDHADVGVGVCMDVPAGMERWHFASDPLLVVLPRGHVLARRSAVGFAQALEWPLIGVRAGGSLDRFVHAQALAAGRSLQMAVSVGSFDAVCRMVEAGLGIAIVPQSAAAAYAGSRHFVRRPLQEDWAARELCLYALRKTPRLRSVQAVIDSWSGPAG
ncbi:MULTISPECIES: LysR family transcriptional regulator [unclassified Acidovorax]|uniref:LysR family transcriptional regulator n=1 Tax=unclassified Acidovorax TaxID=2684926 RepID=UPI0006F1D6B9|nr:MULTISPECIES: LysR family transcriptional regulator [unclassified Acidovorax]KRB40906.1 LysR family transcriptional regulator [Acidovorax sp. Root70]PUA95225.1 DNA-binding transcriptional LysR family regulator [Acidovorax sp. 107]